MPDILAAALMGGGVAMGANYGLSLATGIPATAGSSGVFGMSALGAYFGIQLTGSIVSALRDIKADKYSLEDMNELAKLIAKDVAEIAAKMIMVFGFAEISKFLEINPGQTKEGVLEDIPPFFSVLALAISTNVLSLLLAPGRSLAAAAFESAAIAGLGTEFFSVLLKLNLEEVFPTTGAFAIAVIASAATRLALAARRSVGAEVHSGYEPIEDETPPPASWFCLRLKRPTAAAIPESSPVK